MSKVFAPTVKIKHAEIETPLLPDQWTNDFINWLESRGESCCSLITGIQQKNSLHSKDKKEEK